ncbi:hypothetical protein SAMN04488038_104209 [Solimonas aquatica]|uniref:Uncharacterized protein n=1 Tax=Solimonas aquatica TaxID=489703 RepID=A0A1H9DZJ7_9GAMM|nr:hypothetical protein [Solimonas aquatica]SEQ18353.1 hypothetical protein SAMN04488038_104209 [Solimonas aquatica]
MPRKPKKQVPQNEAPKSFDEFVDEGEALDEEALAADSPAAAPPGKNRDWRDVEKLQEERRLRRLIADDLDFDIG